MILIGENMKNLFKIMMTAVMFTAVSVNAATLVEDKFDSPKKEGRDLAANRGEWKIEKGIATVTQDDKLYEKNKNHGPIMWYDATFKDATIRFAYKAEKAKQFVFTLNDDKGHVFRFIQSTNGLSVRTWLVQGKEGKPVELIAKGTKTPTLPEGKWVEAVVKFEGKKCELTLGDFKQTFEHEAIAKGKTKMGLGFAFGTLSVRDVKIETVAKTAAIR
jgi:hypothetical protein